MIKFDQFLKNKCSSKTESICGIKFIPGPNNNLEDECLEYIVSMMMEPYDNIIDPLINNMSSEEEEYFTIPTHKKVSDLKKILRK